MADILFTLRSGRRIGVSTHGTPAGRRLVVFCHPAPGSGVLDPRPDLTGDHGVHLVAIDRPGYGSSEPLPEGEWPSIVRDADDIAEYLLSSEKTGDAIGVHEFDAVGAVGWSAGGRVALALAARHPDIVDRVAVVATPAPHAEVPWVPEEFVRMSEELGRKDPAEAIETLTGALRARLGPVADGGGDDPEAPPPLEELGVSAADGPALGLPGAEDRIGLMLRDAFRQGPIGTATDILSYMSRPWGFDLGRVRAQTLLLYGTEDPLVGEAHARWYAEHLEHAEVEMVPDAGHFVVLTAWERVLEHVAPGAREVNVGQKAGHDQDD